MDENSAQAVGTDGPKHGQVHILAIPEGMAADILHAIRPILVGSDETREKYGDDLGAALLNEATTFGTGCTLTSVTEPYDWQCEDETAITELA